ncbi:MarR family transcriptional regulator [Actinoplanes sp. NPDC026619]|uniref:MarR family winged helix-turn-helix transcriptional regulator n=1 Tax=Actinoplanes sp. NPDC026619 TaxID=3155798 RepID=UPI00340257E6
MSATAQRDLAAGQAGAPGDDTGLRRLDRVTTLCHTANYVRRHLETAVLRDAHLTWTSYDVLHLAVMHRPIDTGVLAALANVSKGTVTRAAADLTKRGLLRRTTPKQDGRRSVLTPTVAGWELNQRLRAQLVTELALLLSTGSGNQQTAVLHRLVT